MTPAGRASLGVFLLCCSNLFMTTAWYLHLKFKNWTMVQAIFISYGTAFFEYCLQVPANRIAHKDHGGPLGAPQLKIIQEAISITVFALFSTYVLKERLRTTDVVGLLFIFLGVLIAILGKLNAPPDPVPVAPPPPVPAGWETVGLASLGYLAQQQLAQSAAASTPSKVFRFLGLNNKQRAPGTANRKLLSAAPLPHFLDSGAVHLDSFKVKGFLEVEMGDLFTRRMGKHSESETAPLLAESSPLGNGDASRTSGGRSEALPLERLASVVSASDVATGNRHKDGLVERQESLDQYNHPRALGGGASPLSLGPGTVRTPAVNPDAEPQSAQPDRSQAGATHPQDEDLQPRKLTFDP